jgi:hypothetical protein
LFDEKPTSQAEIDKLSERLKKKAQHMGFEDVLMRVDKRLTQRLQFPASYLSLQQARNCLEHRGGIVGLEDCKNTGTLKLSFPRLKIYYLRSNEEVELVAGEIVQSKDGNDVKVLMRLDTRQRELPLGERIALSSAEFNEIAFAAHHMGEHVANRLP